jgi:hypothetical protein
LAFTAEESRRIVTLYEALARFDEMATAITGDDHAKLRLSAQDYVEFGGATRAQLKLDPETAILLLPVIKNLIRDQLEALGVQL